VLPQWPVTGFIRLIKMLMQITQAKFRVITSHLGSVKDLRRKVMQYEFGQRHNKTRLIYSTLQWAGAYKSVNIVSYA